MKELYLDCEWFIGGELFLVGYCFERGKVFQLHHASMTKKKFDAVLNKLVPSAKIYFYGPDIGVLEKYYDIEIRTRFFCVNLLQVFRQLMPRLKSYSLADIERKFKVVRMRQEYKKNIFQIFNDWKSYKWRKFVLAYNYEDVANLRTLKKLVFKKYTVRMGDLKRMR